MDPLGKLSSYEGKTYQAPGEVITVIRFNPLLSGRDEGPVLPANIEVQVTKQNPKYEQELDTALTITAEIKEVRTALSLKEEGPVLTPPSPTSTEGFTFSTEEDFLAFLAKRGASEIQN